MNSIIFFTKENNICKVTSYVSDLDLTGISKLNDIVFDKFSILTKCLTNNKKYKWIGDIEKKRVRFHATKTKAIINI